MEINYEILFWAYLTINIGAAIWANSLNKKKANLEKQRDGLHLKTVDMLKSCMKKKEDIIKNYKLCMEREVYLMKTMNDAMRVTNSKSFMAHRMENAPKHFEQMSEEDVNPDKVD